MNPDEVKQVIETIKTLNINFNDATTQKIAEAILPVVKWVIFEKILTSVFYFVAWLAFFYTIYRIIKTIVDAEKEKHFETEKRILEESKLNQ